MKHDTTVTRTSEIGGWHEMDIVVTVEYTAHPFHRGATDGRHGPPLEPSEPAHIEIEGVFFGAEPFEATDEELERFEEDIIDSLFDMSLSEEQPLFHKGGLTDDREQQRRTHPRT